MPAGYHLDNDRYEVEVCCNVGAWLETQSDHGRDLADTAWTFRMWDLMIYMNLTAVTWPG